MKQKARVGGSSVYKCHESESVSGTVKHRMAPPPPAAGTFRIERVTLIVCQTK